MPKITQKTAQHTILQNNWLKIASRTAALPARHPTNKRLFMLKYKDLFISRNMKTLPQENRAEHSTPIFHPSVFEKNLPHHHPHPHFDRAVVSWIAPEYLQHPKSVRWWIVAAIITVLAMISEAFYGN